jgi:N-acyl-D-amino-acid deacylase
VVLESAVRKYGVISLKQAIHQLTAKAAGLVSLRERGELREGWHADIVIFDPNQSRGRPRREILRCIVQTGSY